MEKSGSLTPFPPHFRGGARLDVGGWGWPPLETTAT
jgi:hypothetical protein